MAFLNGPGVLNMISRALIVALLNLVLCVHGTQVMVRPAIYDKNTTTFVQVGAPSTVANRPPVAVAPAQVQISAATGGNSGRVSIAYFVNWGIYARNFQVTNIIPDSLTHVLYSFGDCDSTSGNVILTDLYADQQKHNAGDSWNDPTNDLYGNLKQLFLLKQKNRNLKVLFSIGGWTYSQSGHFNFVTNPASRANFVSSALTLLEDNGFDGIDIDYEYPSTKEQGQGLADLLTELRAALDDHASKKGDTVPYVLTTAVSAGEKGYGQLVVPQMDAALSYWNIMTYDYAGSFSNVSADQANVYGGTATGFSTDSAISWYLKNGATPSKITMGIPLYGRSFEGTNGLDQTFSGVGSGSFENGIWDYKALPLAGATIIEDNNDIASYSYDASKKELISYDTPNIAAKKAQYILDKGLAGAMYWELSGDKVGQDSLVARVNSVLGSLQQEDNHISYPGSKFGNVRNGMTGGSSTSPGSPGSGDSPGGGASPSGGSGGNPQSPFPTGLPQGRGFCRPVKHQELRRRSEVDHRSKRSLSADVRLAISGLLR